MSTTIAFRSSNMSFSKLYDGGSVEIRGSSPFGSINSDCQECDDDAEYVYMKFRIANKRLSSMEDQMEEMASMIDYYTITLQKETQFREMCQQSLFEEQVRHDACRRAYLRLSKVSSDTEQTAHHRQIKYFLTVIEELEKKICIMTEQHVDTLRVAADHTSCAEEASERLQRTAPKLPESSSVDDLKG